jgi:hypothetical protein
MAERQPAVRAVEWQEVFPAVRLLMALRIAFNFRAILLAAIAVAGMTAGWRLCGDLFADPDDLWFTEVRHVNDVWPWELARQPISLGELASVDGWRLNSPLLMVWYKLTGPFVQLFEAHRLTHFAYLAACCLWTLLIWSFFGGAISRQAAVAFAREENVSTRRLIGFVNSRLGAYFVAPLFPILGVFLAAVGMALVGLLMKLGAGVIVAAVLWPLVLLGGFMMAFLLIGLFFGWPLMWGAISAEGTDSFGALSHAYSYAYQRPLRYLLYVLIAAVAGVLAWYLVLLFAHWILQLAYWGVSWGSGIDRLEAIATLDTSSAAGVGAAIIDFWNNCLRTLAMGFLFSYFWSASTAIYFLLRRQVDATELDVVYLPEEQALHAMPALKTDPNGVPAVAEDPTDG